MTGSERAQRERAGRTVCVLDELPRPGPDPLRAGTVPRDGVQTVIFTSGTTGAPKPVELTYANHTASALAAAWNVGLDPDDRWLSALPLFHVGGLAIILRAGIYGTTAVIHEQFDPDRVVQALEREAITLCSLVPTMLRRLRDAGLNSAPDLRACLLGGAPVPVDLLDWARAGSLPIVPTYGMTETASQVATLSPAEALAGIRGARPLNGVEFDSSPSGELLVRGPMVAAGELSDDGWLRTGDLGRIDDAGLLQIEGRVKDLIVTGGENVGPAEVEQALLSHPAVSDAAVLGVPDPEWGEAIVALVILRDAVEDVELLDHCRERISSYKIPKRIERVQELPRNAAGKLLRAELQIPDR
ncbi:MAG: AMP-binding protein [Thermoleophilaceae bacterium]|nr:AMP-binding protein [Thermoleophilaceae bacterium]